MLYMKRSFIAISVATIIGLSACATKVSSSTSMNSPISTSVTSEQEFLSNLENASTSQILQKLKESDGGYKNLAVFATLAVFLLSVSEIADPCCAVFLGHKLVPDTALCRSHGA